MRKVEIKLNDATAGWLTQESFELVGASGRKRPPQLLGSSCGGLRFGVSGGSVKPNHFRLFTELASF